MIDAEPKSPTWIQVLSGCMAEIVCEAVIRYDFEPIVPDLAEPDTKRIARAVLKGIQAAGHNPSAEAATVIVNAVYDQARGETGTRQTHFYGAATYDPKTDSLSFSTKR
jgi:hypothetical protein